MACHTPPLKKVKIQGEMPLLSPSPYLPFPTFFVSGNRTSGSKSFFSIQSSFKGCPRQLAYTSFQLMHITREVHAVQNVQAMAARRRQNLLQRSQHRHQGEF